MAARSVLKEIRAGDRHDDWRPFHSLPIELPNDLNTPALRMFDIDQDDVGMKLHDCIVYSGVARILDLDLNVQQFRDFPTKPSRTGDSWLDEQYFDISIIAGASSNLCRSLSDIFAGLQEADL